MSDKKNPVAALITSIGKSKNTSDLADKLGEVALDSLLNAGVLKNIPIIGTALSLLKAGDDIRANIFAKKIISFLSEIDSIPESQRKLFFEKHCSNDKDTNQLGEVTLMILDKIDHPALSSMLGRAFARMIKEPGGVRTFEFHASIIKNLNSYLIRQISSFYGGTSICSIDTVAAIQLSNYGIIQIKALGRMQNEESGLAQSIQKTDFGKFFYEYFIKDSKSSAA